jgi:5-methyltetrahydropteroyltriglutamate--homocysteine methyltransferase
MTQEHAVTTTETPALPLARLRVDTVGSFLRPDALKRAFADHGAGRLDDAGLAAAQDEAVRAVVAEQERRGMPVVTDGEYRRHMFMESFAEVAGMERWQRRWARQVSELEVEKDDRVKAGTNPLLLDQEPVTKRLALRRNVPREEYGFAQGLATSPVKVSLINPDRILQSMDVAGSLQVYATDDELLADVVAVEREIIAGLREAGCRYVHIDAPGYTAYVDPASLEAMRARGEDPDARLERAIAADNDVLAGFDDITFGVHVCRGNRHSQWHREGYYDAIAERLFAGLGHQRLLLEYDDERSGDFSPLRHVPPGKTVVLGLITTKRGALESADDLKRRIEDATRYVPVEQLALSPQCGFASDIAGNAITEDEQWRKIERMLEVASEVWSA